MSRVVAAEAGQKTCSYLVDQFPQTHLQVRVSSTPDSNLWLSDQMIATAVWYFQTVATKIGFF